MNETFLHHAWKYRLFTQQKLTTTKGEPVTILKQGDHNSDAGPDFFNARIRIGDTLWAGNVEIHVKTSDWQKHGHQNDASYSTIILHVVYDDDSKDQSNNTPVIELKNFLDPEVYEKYIRMASNTLWIPCLNQLQNIDSITIRSWSDRMMAEKLESKVDGMTVVMNKFKNHTEEILYQQLASNFGFKINSEPFLLLARSLPLKILLKHRDNLKILEALLFGQSGLLSGYKGNEEYPLELINEYEFYRNKYNLKPIDAHLWKYLRLRPMNFPTIRIAQFAALIHFNVNIHASITSLTSVQSLEKLLSVQASSFWDSHYTFSKISTTTKKSLGKDGIQNIIINTVVPFVFMRGKLLQDESICNRALQFLKELPPEKNHIISGWEQAGLKSGDAFDSQALIFLRKSYCLQKKCLNCGIGLKILTHT